MEYRAPAGSVGSVEILPEAAVLPVQEEVEILVRPKCKLPAPCIEYVPDASRPATWKLPYRMGDGAVYPKRLLKASQAILGNYRGARVGGIPESDMRAVLSRFARAAWRMDNELQWVSPSAKSKVVCTWPAVTTCVHRGKLEPKLEPILDRESMASPKKSPMKSMVGVRRFALSLQFKSGSVCGKPIVQQITAQLPVGQTDEGIRAWRLVPPSR